MKSVREILLSAEFMRAVSLLLFFFAGLSSLYSAIIFTGKASDPDVTAAGIAIFVQAIIYVVLAILIRRGSTKALWAAGILFGLDTLLILVSPLGKGVAHMLIGRGLLVYILVRYIRKQRVTTT